MSNSPVLYFALFFYVLLHSRSMEELEAVVEQRDYIGAIVFMSSHVCVCIDESKRDKLVLCTRGKQKHTEHTNLFE